MDHARQHENSKLDFDIGTCEHFVRALCTPRPHEATHMIVRDDNFQKVPRTNSLLCHELFSGSVTKWLTMFAAQPSKSPVQSVYIPLCGYKLATNENWYSHLISNMLNGIKKFPIGHRECRIAPSTPLVHMRIKRLLFFWNSSLMTGHALFTKVILIQDDVLRTVCWTENMLHSTINTKK